MFEEQIKILTLIICWSLSNLCFIPFVNSHF